jgi:hypothetical protein
MQPSTVHSKSRFGRARDAEPPSRVVDTGEARARSWLACSERNPHAGTIAAENKSVEPMARGR